MAPAAARLAGAEDALEVARLLHDFNTEFGDPTPTVDALAGRVRALLEAGAIVAVLAGEPPTGVGVMRLKPMLFSADEQTLDAYLEELYVAPERRGGGLGRALLELAMATARERGAFRIELGTSEDDVAARALYESAGFTNREGEGGPVMYVYERDL